MTVYPRISYLGQAVTLLQRSERLQMLHHMICPALRRPTLASPASKSAVHRTFRQPGGLHFPMSLNTRSFLDHIMHLKGVTWAACTGLGCSCRAVWGKPVMMWCRGCAGDALGGWACCSAFPSLPADPGRSCRQACNLTQSWSTLEVWSHS